MNVQLWTWGSVKKEGNFSMKAYVAEAADYLLNIQSPSSLLIESLFG